MGYTEPARGMIGHFVITVLVIYGIHASTRLNMILFKPFDYIGRKLTPIIGIDATIMVSKVLCDCTPCMASIYGTISYIVLFTAPSIFGLVVWVFSLSGFNYILNKVINR